MGKIEVTFTAAMYLALVVLLLFAMIGFLIGAILTKGDPFLSLIFYLVFGFIGTAGFPIIFGVTKALLAMITGGG